MNLPRWLFALALLALVGSAGYRVLAAAGDDARALSTDPVARLQTAPLDGAPFGDLAVASAAADDPARIRALHEIAVRRDPRDLRVRAWLADLHLRSGHYQDALDQLDVILRLSPESRKTLLPMMALWADDPEFANALAMRLQTGATWRGPMLAALGKDPARPGAGAVFAALSTSGDMSDKEVSNWLDALMVGGNWGLAYSYWAGGLDLPAGVALPMIYNGGFEQAPSQLGFDWRTDRQTGTYTEFGPADGAHGDAAHLVFLGRPVETANLEQALALPPGRYRIDMRARALGLRSDQGLQWAITCARQRTPLAVGERLDGTFGWQETSMAFEIPESGCPGQWLRLDNPAPGGSASIVTGELWIDRMALRPVAAPAAASIR